MPRSMLFLSLLLLLLLLLFWGGGGEEGLKKIQSE